MSFEDWRAPGKGYGNGYGYGKGYGKSKKGGYGKGFSGGGGGVDMAFCLRRVQQGISEHRELAQLAQLMDQREQGWSNVDGRSSADWMGSQVPPHASRPAASASPAGDPGVQAVAKLAEAITAALAGKAAPPAEAPSGLDGLVFPETAEDGTTVRLAAEVARLRAENARLQSSSGRSSTVSSPPRARTRSSTRGSCDLGVKSGLSAIVEAALARSVHVDSKHMHHRRRSRSSGHSPRASARTSGRRRRASSGSSASATPPPPPRRQRARRRSPSEPSGGTGHRTRRRSGNGRRARSSESVASTASGRDGRRCDTHGPLLPARTQNGKDKGTEKGKSSGSDQKKGTAHQEPKNFEVPAMITPDMHKAVLAWVGAGGSIEDRLPREVWLKQVAKRWKRDEWVRRLKPHGVPTNIEGKEALLDEALRAFVRQAPEWAEH